LHSAYVAAVLQCATALFHCPNAYAESPSTSKRRSTSEHPPNTVVLPWRTEWRAFDTVEYIATAALIAGWAIVEFAVEPREDPRWSGGILFDDAARDALVSETREGRNRAGRISDYTALAPQVTLFADTIIVPWARGGSFKLKGTPSS
jgi:hypothetical protein